MELVIEQTIVIIYNHINNIRSDNISSSYGDKIIKTTIASDNKQQIKGERNKYWQQVMKMRIFVAVDLEIKALI